MNSRGLEDRQEREFAERLATQLDLTPEQLDELDWSIDENVGNDGTVYGYVVTFEKTGDPVAQAIIDRLTDRRGWIQIGPFL